MSRRVCQIACYGTKLRWQGEGAINGQPHGKHSRTYLSVLDGWRALSILAVIAGHWFPLGPASWGLNASFAASGMALFFTLSGFLITYFLLADDRIWPFVVKRITRIVPLAWAAMVLLVVVNGPSERAALGNFMFVANLPPDTLLPGGHHLWSLCVEIHFYLLAALMVGLLGRKALWGLPLLCLGVTGLRIGNGEVISIVTWHRIDEILVGGCVALWWHYRRETIAPRTRGLLPWVPVAALVGLLAAALPYAGAAGYLRPYLAALAVGGSLAAFPPVLHTVYTSRPARYVAEISYALYVVHGVLWNTWLGGKEADKIMRYFLRIPLVLATWGIAHLSTRYYEAFFMRQAREYLKRRDAKLMDRVRPI